MRLALVATDNRQNDRRYERTEPYFGTAPEALLQGFSRIPELEVHVLSCTQQPMRSPDKLAENIWFHSLPVPKWGWMRTGYLGCIQAVRRKCRQLQPDLVHGQGTERECALSAAFSGFKNLVTIHGHMHRMAEVTSARPFSYLWNAARLESLALKRCQGVICLSQYHRRKMTRLGARTWVVPNAVDEAFFGLEPARAEEKEVLCVAHISPWKNQNALILALDDLVKDLPFRLVLMGGVTPASDYGAEFLNLVRARPWCQHVNGASRMQIKEALTRARVSILPSLEDNCPMAVLEAMAAGVAVVAARVGGVPDLIEPETTGLLFSNEQPAEMRACLRRLLEDSPLAQRLSEAARQFARRTFHPEVIASRHLEIYREVITPS